MAGAGSVDLSKRMLSTEAFSASGLAGYFLIRRSNATKAPRTSPWRLAVSAPAKRSFCSPNLEAREEAPTVPCEDAVRVASADAPSGSQRVRQLSPATQRGSIPLR